MITGTKAVYHLLQHIIRPGHDFAAALKRGQGNLWIPVNTFSGLKPYLVGSNQRGSELIRVNTGAHGIAAWFEPDQDTRVTDFSTQTFEGKPYGGWMMGEIIVNMDIIFVGNQFQAPLYTAE